MSLSLDFISKECKNEKHSFCKYQWEGLGFQIICNCECHDKKIVLGKDEVLPNTIGSIQLSR
jgi:hypothetical protein